VRRCAQGVADYLQASELANKGIVIGYDTRFASADFARASAEVLAGNNVKVYLTDKPTPTPVVSYGIVAHKAGGGIVITASHNPAQWNGFKYKTPDGASAPTDIVTEIEQYIATTQPGSIKRLDIDKAVSHGWIEYTDLKPVYTEQINRIINTRDIKQANFKIVVDSMHGSGSGYFRMLLEDSQDDVIEINAEPNPNFPGMKQPEPIAPNLSRLAFTVRQSGASVGLATDGDSDRIGIIDEHGNFLTQLQVYALLALYLLEVRGERGAIVKSITTTSMLYRLGELYGVPVFEVPVGFKYVAPVMLEENAMIGGEESGGYGFRGHVPERDALVAGLYFLDFMAKTGKTPSQLLDYLYSKVGPHYYDRMDIYFNAAERDIIVKRVEDSFPPFLDGVKVLKKDPLDGFRFILEDGGWLLIRFSGTEPVLRIYAETSSPQKVQRLLELGAELAGPKS
jgi:alpha-D-glucose phosphate-specific phosphoglucomutase